MEFVRRNQLHTFFTELDSLTDLAKAPGWGLSSRDSWQRGAKTSTELGKVSFGSDPTGQFIPRGVSTTEVSPKL